jgi:hypothetical protein
LNINEPLGCFPISEQVLISEHDDKEMNDKEQDDDHYEIGVYHPTDISVPGSMAAAERADERHKLKMVLMRGLASQSPHQAGTTTCSAQDS